MFKGGGELYEDDAAKDANEEVVSRPGEVQKR